MDKVKINNFIPIWGDFIFKDKCITFKGAEKSIDSKNNMFSSWSSAKQGLVLFPILFKDGKIRVKIKFDEVDASSFCGVVYDYFPLLNSVVFQYAGVSNTDGYFCGTMTPNGSSLNFKLGKQNTIQAGKEYIIEVEIMGSYLQIVVNGVTVGNNPVVMKNIATNIGLYIQNTSDVQILDIEASYQNPKAFVVMQFSDEYKAIYEDVIKTICIDKGYDVIRGDESYDTGMIISDIVKRIEESSLIIADITPDNPNVFYEVGYAHALKKPTILMSDKTREKLPFDVSGFRTIFYDNKIGGKKVVEDTLRKFLDELNIGNPNK